MKMGKPLKIRRYWLDIDYPYQPPIEYCRSGYAMPSVSLGCPVANHVHSILLTDDGMEWSTQPVDSSVVHTVNRILWPSPLFLSTWAFAGAMIRTNIQDVLRALGSEPGTSSDFRTPTTPQGTPTAPGSPSPLPAQHHPDIQRALQALQKQATKRPGDVKDPRAMSSPGQSEAPYPASPPSTQTPGTSQAPDPTPGKPTADSKKPDALSPGRAEAQAVASVPEPWKAFKRQLVKAWKRVPEPPPRGSVLVSGLVELEAPKGWTVVDVVAYWDPKTRQIDEKSMMVRLRRLQMRNQAPSRR